MSTTTQELIKNEIENLIIETKKAASSVRTFALAEVWKILQLLTATVIQIIENLGNDLSSPEKKELAMELIGKFYDEIFKYIDVPWIPTPLEVIMHGYLKTVLMMLVSSGIDAMVTTFRQIGVFNKKDSIEAQSETSDNKIISDFINDIKKIVREK
jgi:hypothetical protein